MAYAGSHSYPYPIANSSQPTPQSHYQYPNPRPARPTAAPRSNAPVQKPSPAKRQAPQKGKFDLLQYMTTEQLQKLLENEKNSQVQAVL